MNQSKTQIVATIGPATEEKETIAQLINHHMDVARLNFSWGSGQDHEDRIKTIRAVSEELGKRIPIIADLAGPRIASKEGHHFDSSEQKNPTDKDLADLKFAINHSIEYIGQSYVGTAGEILNLKKETKNLNSTSRIIAKIERKLALENLEEIIEVADAIMVARGDLGNEVPLEKIPFIERTIIQKCKAASKPVITATQMLFSMTERPQPTRAEVTDVAFAILNGSDALMLSEETATGKYPVAAVEMMERIILEAESHLAEIKFNLL